MAVNFRGAPKASVMFKIYCLIVYMPSAVNGCCLIILAIKKRTSSNPKADVITLPLLLRTFKDVYKHSKLTIKYLVSFNLLPIFLNRTFSSVTCNSFCVYQFSKPSVDKPTFLIIGAHNFHFQISASKRILLRIYKWFIFSYKTDFS